MSIIEVFSIATPVLVSAGVGSGLVHDRQRRRRNWRREHAQHVWQMEKSLGWEPWPIFGLQPVTASPPTAAFLPASYAAGYGMLSMSYASGWRICDCDLAAQQHGQRCTPKCDRLKMALRGEQP